MNQNNFKTLPLHQLEQMRFAASEITECERVVKKSGRNMIQEVTECAEKLTVLQKYPSDSIIDSDNHSSCYYHSHKKTRGEHGHIHFLIRSSGFPTGVLPLNYTENSAWPRADKAHAHLIAISLDKCGKPVKLFTTNAWVTEEVLFNDHIVQQMVDLFLLDHAYPSWAFNRWATALIYLFKPQIQWLIGQRTATLTAWQNAHPDRSVLHDERIEILNELKISVPRQINQIEQSLALFGDQNQRAAS